MNLRESPNLCSDTIGLNSSSEWNKSNAVGGGDHETLLSEASGGPDIQIQPPAPAMVIVARNTGTGKNANIANNDYPQPDHYKDPPALQNENFRNFLLESIYEIFKRFSSKEFKKIASQLQFTKEQVEATLIDAYKLFNLTPNTTEKIETIQEYCAGNSRRSRKRSSVTS